MDRGAGYQEVEGLAVDEVGVPVAATSARTASAWIGGVVSAAAYGFTPTIAAIGYAGGVSPTVLVFLRSVIGGVLLVTMAVATGRWRVPIRDAAILTLVCGPLFATQLLCFFAAIRLTGAQLAIVVAHVSPVFVLVISVVILRRPARPVAWVICGVMIAGIAFVAGESGGHIAVPGLLLAVACALGYAAYYVIGEPCLRRVSVVAATGLTSLGAALAAGFVLLFLTPASWSFTASGWLSIVAQGVLILPLGIGGGYLAVRVLGPVPGSLLGLLEAVVGVLAASIFLGESLTWSQWAGVGVLLAASAALPWARVGHQT
ncbi:MAG: DMT family transporter [Gordonia sp. (in: high G+C Gram-positive bacteria)]